MNSAVDAAPFMPVQRRWKLRAPPPLTVIEQTSGHADPREEGVYAVQEWTEVRRVSRDGWTNTAIAEKFGMSRNTVAGLIAPTSHRVGGRRRA